MPTLALYNAHDHSLGKRSGNAALCYYFAGKTPVNPEFSGGKPDIPDARLTDVAEYA
ncbi:MAG: hypothetical protein FWF99_03440 [Desulfovibrionaceae bacterium]|nr:hypothetical protein [Desulfovibrionaceae bacterium]